MLDALRVGCPWRDMHEGSGQWNAVDVRLRRWAEQGAWDARLQTLVDLGLKDDWQPMINSMSVRAHVSAAGAKRGSSGSSWSITRRRYEQNPRPM